MFFQAIFKVIACRNFLEAFLKLFFFVFSLEQQMDHNDMYKGLAIVG